MSSFKSVYSESEIETLLHRFFSLNMKREEWTHQAHLVLAIHTCWNHPGKEAGIIRDAILAFNGSVGVPNTDEGGYHETITLFWIAVARKFIDSGNFRTVTDACNAFVSDPVYSTNYPKKYYPEEVLFSVQARKSWIAPGDITSADFAPDLQNSEL